MHVLRVIFEGVSVSLCSVFVFVVFCFVFTAGEEYDFSSNHHPLLLAFGLAEVFRVFAATAMSLLLGGCDVLRVRTLGSVL